MTTSKKLCRDGQPCQPVTLREAWHCQMHHSEMRLDEIARHVGMNPNTLSAAVNPTGDDALPAARHHELLLSLTKDNAAVLTYFAQVQGRVVVAIDASSPIAKAAESCKTFGSLLSTVSEANADGIVDPLERAQIKHYAHAHMAIVAALAESVDLQPRTEPRLAEARR